jgi:hypothetical protein
MPTNACHSSIELALAVLLLGLGCSDPDRNNGNDDENGIAASADWSDTQTAESAETADGSGGDDSSADDGGSGEDPADDTADSTDGTTESCGGEIYTATNIPPNMLIVQDRSGSMEEHIDDLTKWEIAQAAIEQVVAAYADQVSFGLMLYPGTDDKCDEGMDCGPGHIFVEIGPDTTAAIIAALQASDTCTLGTPTAETLEPLLDYPGLEDPERSNYILLITDGQSTCDNPVSGVEALALENPSIQTFVVGFGEGVDPDELNDMAVAGGTALAGDTKYYQASDAQALVDAFADIAGNVLSCTYLLDQIPPDPDDLYVYLDGVAIPRDQTHVDGWDYDPMTNQISFHGPACQQLQSGVVTDLQIIFGCPTVG